MGKKRSARSRRRRGGKRKYDSSVFISTISSAAGFAQSDKTYSLAQCIPDVGSGRSCIVRSVSCQYIPTSTTSGGPPPATGATVALFFQGAPFTADASRVLTQSWRTLSSVNPTTMTVTAKGAQLVPVQIGTRSGAMICVSMVSNLPCACTIKVITRYTLTPDITIIAI